MGSPFIYPRIATIPQDIIDFSSSGNNIVVNAISGKRISIYAIWLIPEGATVLIFKDGSSTELSGPISLEAHQELMLPLRGEPWFVTSVGNAFIINSSNAVQVGGVLSYDTSEGPASTGYTAIVIFDDLGIRWGVTVLTSGNLDSELTPSGPSDYFYVDPLVLKDSANVLWITLISTAGNIGTFQYVVPAVILNDPNSVRWAVTVNTSGNLISTVTPSGPSNAFNYGYFVMEDSNGIFWQVSIDISGHLVTTIVGSSLYAFNDLYIVDSNSGIWKLTVSIAGNLTTTLVSSNPTSYSSIELKDSNLTSHTLTISTLGNLITT